MLADLYNQIALMDLKVANMQTKVDNVKAEVLSSTSMVPDWSNTQSVPLRTTITTPSNGYYACYTNTHETDYDVMFDINGVTWTLSGTLWDEDWSGRFSLLMLPVKKGDVMRFWLKRAYKDIEYSGKKINRYLTVDFIPVLTT